jgi:hypothetical protein
MKGCLPYIIALIALVAVYGYLMSGDKGGFDSIGRFFVFAIFVIGVYLAFKYRNTKKD